MKAIAVEQLKKGTFFKAKKHRRWRMALNAQILPNNEGIPEEDRGKVLVSYAMEYCRHELFTVGEQVQVYEP